MFDFGGIIWKGRGAAFTFINKPPLPPLFFILPHRFLSKNKQNTMTSSHKRKMQPISFRIQEFLGRSRHMLSIQGYRGTLSAWYWCQGNRLKIPILRCFWGYMLLWDTIKMLFLLYSMRLSRLKYSDNKYTHYSFWDKMINRQVECRNLLSFVKMHKRRYNSYLV